MGGALCAAHLWGNWLPLNSDELLLGVVVDEPFGEFVKLVDSSVA